MVERLPTILGVDPGGASSGLVVRRGSELLWHATVDGGWRQVLEALAGMPPVVGFFDVLAIEEVVAPRGFADGKQKPINLPGLLGTAVVAGAVAGWGYTDSGLRIIWVPPAHNGQGALDSYPDELRPTRGQGRGQDGLRHVRSAWDVAGTASIEARGRLLAGGVG